MDVKANYSSTVQHQKAEADRQRERGDDRLYISILRGKARNLMYRQNWQEVSLPEIVERFAPRASPIVKGNKIHYRSLDGAIDVLVDIGGGYLRIQDLKHSTRKRPEYLDLSGHNPRYVIVSGKKVRVLPPEQYNPITHFRIKHMLQIESPKHKS
ncbi:hypothetical protein [Bifidobacterium jacchi]|uniref:Uncharacterized protein n=1 Tax=Bifidobacterium jacchi TaxID=2490545 RepID=A0A5N5REV0_9BIFI|nr:hypothetical protein [Bifidobacterium jacchi]KAB5605779.1 hypothetical protein EHS19_08720 [Bifidobacterium jacchi]